METSAPAQPNALPLRRGLTLALLAALVIGYAWFLRAYTAPYAGGSDSSGYLNSASLLLSGQLSTTSRTLTGHTAGEFGLMAHQPLGFITRAGTDQMTPSYPIGLPLHLAAFSFLVGLDWAAIPLNICSALAGGALLYLLARRLDLPPFLALAGALVLLLCPLYLFSALQPMSDLLALVWVLASLYAALRAREGWRWGLACGVAVACAVLVRPTNLLLAVPVVLALGLNWRAGCWVGLGGLPGALLLATYNRQVYGSPFVTGYGEIWTAFSPGFVPHNLGHFARWIPGLLSPVILAALAAPFLRTTRRREFCVLGSWALMLIGLYAFYYHSGETWWYLRFILPAFPVLILAALAALHALTLAAPARRILVSALLVAGLAWETGQAVRLGLVHNKSGEATYPDAAAWVRQQLPANAVIFCMQVSGAFYYYTDFVLVRWDQVMPGGMVPLFQALREEQRPVYAVLYEFEEPEARKRMGGRWTRIAGIRHATVWRVEPVPPSP
jgi:hypothetical protein